MRQEEQIRSDIVEVGRRLHSRAYVASNDGNISVRLSEDCLLTTPKGVSKGFMSPDMIVMTDLSGRKIAGDRDPSSELPMHLAVYQNRPEITAVVHAHPPVSTGFAVAGIPLDRAVLAEVVTTLGSIPIADYGTPSTPELADAVTKYIKAHDGLLLANHGALTIAGELFAAYYKMETIEHFARISLAARLLGGERMLSRDEVMRLQGLREMYGISSPAPICADGSSETTDVPSEDTNDVTCQVLQAPVSTNGRLVKETMSSPDSEALGKDGEIRLTYRELSALIEDAVKHLR
jgi:L-fuculose-phosphate aldolase